MSEEKHKGKPCQRWAGGQGLPWFISCLCQFYTCLPSLKAVTHAPIEAYRYISYYCQICVILQWTVCVKFYRAHSFSPKLIWKMERFLYQTASIEGIRTTQKLCCDTLWFGFCHVVHVIYYSFFDYVRAKTKHAVSSVFTFNQTAVPCLSPPATQVTLWLSISKAK